MGKLWEPDDRYFPSRRLKNRRKSPMEKEQFMLKWQKRLWHLGAATLIFFLVCLVFQIDSQAIRPVQSKIRDWFTEDYDIRPVLKLFSEIGVWGDTFDRAAFEMVQGEEGPGTLTVPVSGQVTKPFGWIVSPDNTQRFHDGIVIAAPEGSTIKAAMAGTVTRLANEAEMGRLVEITGEGGYVTTYAHCSEILVNLNDQVYAGQVIAKVGKSGQATHPQLFFRIRDKSGVLDPGKLFISGTDKT